jgi:hypothetical protein
MRQIERRRLLLGGLSASALLAGRSVAQTSAAPSILSSETTIPRRAATAIEDMLVQAAKIAPGQRVLILSYTDGLYGGDNLVDRDAVRWIQQAVEAHGATPTVMWVDLPAEAHQWQFPEEVREAFDRCDLMIYHCFDLSSEEIIAFREYTSASGKIALRNFASTAPLLCTDWALTPHELVSEIRYQAARPIQPGLEFEIADEHGTHLEGVILPSRGFRSYTERRGKGAVPFPEWVNPPINLGETSGVFVFDRMLSWWSRYIGIPPYFGEPIRVEVRQNRMVKIEGGSEAEALRRFLDEMRTRVGDAVYNFDRLHFGVHPNAEVQPHQCPPVLYRRLIEHAHTSNLHAHIGSPSPTKAYPYWVHCTGDIRSATFRVGDTVVQDKGRLTALDSPDVRQIAAKYPGRPGV